MTQYKTLEIQALARQILNISQSAEGDDGRASKSELTILWDVTEQPKMDFRGVVKTLR